MRVFIAIALSSAGLFAQAAAPAFDAASVQPTRHGRNGEGWSHSSISVVSRGRMVAENSSLYQLIRFAYNLKDSEMSGPRWLKDDSVCFDIVATAPAASHQQIRLMLQTLLRERFHLEVHRETRTLSVYNLVPASSGPKLHASTGGEGPGVNSNTDSGGLSRLTATRISMADLADDLSRRLERPVFNRTGIEGRYDFSLHFADGGLVAALRKELGLRLESDQAPVEVLVVDHIDRTPTAN